MNSNDEQDSDIRFYLVDRTAVPTLRDLAAVAPVLPGAQERLNKIRLHLRDAPVQYRGRGEHLATMMAFVDDNALVAEIESELRSQLELHVHGRVTIYAASAEQRARAAPTMIDTSTLQQYWEEEQFQTSDAGAEIHAALASLHANLMAAGDESVVLVHW